MAIQVTNYQCPACTGPLHFVGESGKLECDYCGNNYEVSVIETLYADKEQAAAEAKPTQWQTEDVGSPWSEAEAAGIKSYTCPSCGAGILCDATTAATSCVYCGNPTVVPGQLGGALKPDYVIPFKLDKESAKAALRKHYKGKLFLPKSFSEANHIEEIKSVYAPFWLFDGKADANVRYKCEKISSVTVGNTKTTTTEAFRVVRQGSVSFEKVPVDGSTKMPDAHMDAIEPYDYNDLKPFSTAYLPGHLADKYDLDATACADRADERIKVSTQDAMRATVTGYDTVTPEFTDINLKQGDIKYALLPVWMLSTKWKGQNYLFAMNGQTGKLIGDLPVDKGKFWMWFLGIAAVLAIPFGLLFI